MITNKNDLTRFAGLAGAAVVEGVYAFFAVWGIVRLLPAFQVSTKVWMPEAIFNGLRPEHDTLLYIVYLSAAFAAAVWLGRTLPKKESTSCRSFWVIETILVSLIVAAAFKMIVYDYRLQLAQNAFYALLTVSFLHKMFWRWTRNQLAMIHSFGEQPLNRPILEKLAELFCIGFIFAAIYIPYPEGILARMFVGEQFHHFNHAVMGPAWAFVKGAALNNDVISPYGLGLPVVLVFLSKLFGAFSYEHVMMAIIWIHVMYFLGWYLFLRMWLGSRALALAAVLWAVKTQMFHTGVFPIVYTYPSATIVRYCFDIVMFWCVWKHVLKGERKFLVMAAALSGFSIFYLTDTGVYLSTAYYGYLVILLLKPQWRALICKNRQDLWFLMSLFVLPAATLVFFLILTQGGRWASWQFLANMHEFIEWFISGFGLTPMSDSLKYHNFSASLMGFLLPAVYTATLIIIGSLCFLGKLSRRYIFVMVLCIYGLGIYHYYVARSAVTSYYAVGVPSMAIAMFWIKAAIDHLVPRAFQTAAAMSVLGLLTYSLLTTHNFVSYPNLLNVSKNPMTDPLVAQPLPNNRQTYFNHLWHDYPQELRLPVNFMGETDERLVTGENFPTDDQLVEYYQREFSFPEDVAMIKRMTGPKEKVALLSSFDVKMLMDADRRPLFYYFPFANERPMYMRTFFVERIYTMAELKRVIDQLETEKPKYIFMEKILLAPEVPNQYNFQMYGMMRILEYVYQHYRPIKENGKYLTPMERVR